MPAERSTETGEHKRRVLERVLASSTFARSDKLKHFLRYICDMEIAGRGAELNEYVIGVEALGRPADYSPVEDSIVRSTAYVLRQKLQEVYSRELADDGTRLELPKGCYIPQFVDVTPSAPENEHRIEESPGGVARLDAAPATRVGWRSRSIAGWAFIAGFLAAAILGGAALLIWPRQAGVQPDPVVRRAWGPLADKRAEVFLGVSNPAQLIVHTFESGAPPPEYIPLPSQIPRPREEWKLRSDLRNDPLFGSWSDTSPYLGDAMAAVTAARTLTSLGIAFQAMPTKNLYVPAFGSKNLIVVGSPEYSGTVRRILARTPLDIGVDSASGKAVVMERDPRSGTVRPYVPKSAGGSQKAAYGLITAVPSEGSTDFGHRTLLVSGTSAAAAHGAMEYFSNRKMLEELEAKFRSGGRTTFPPAFQVIVRCVEVNDLMVSFAYETHRILDPRLPLR